MTIGHSRICKIPLDIIHDNYHLKYHITIIINELIGRSKLVLVSPASNPGL